MKALEYLLPVPPTSTDPDPDQPIVLAAGSQLLPAPENSGAHPATDVRRNVRAGMIAIAAIFGGLGIWMSVAPLAGAVIAPGTIKVDLNRKTLQHLEGGIVNEIRVRDGDHVNKGETLITIVDERTDATVDVLQGQLDAELARGARLTAERSLSDTIVFPEQLLKRRDSPTVSELLQTETTFFETKRKALLEQLALFKQQEVEAQQEIESLAGRADAEMAGAALLKQELEANEELAARHFIQKTRILELKRGIEDYRARRGEHLADMARARQHITDLELRSVGLQNEYLQNAAQELTVVSAKSFDFQERLRPSRDAQRRQHIVAPISGTVVALKVFTIGGIIAPREPLLDIVPDNNPLIVEAMVSVDSIDDVRVGQASEVQLTAFARRNTPLVDGKVTYVSADRLTDRNGENAYYLTHVVIDPQALAELGNLKLSPGMSATVFIQTETRTALQYLMAPITGSMRRSFREP